MEKRDDHLLILGVFLILALGVGAYFGTRDMSFASFTGSAVNVSSQVSVQVIISAGPSTNLADGITFQDVDILPSTVNATDNENGAGGGSTLYISIGPSTNVAVDICVNASAPLSNGPNTIPIAGYTFSNSTVSTGPVGPPGVKTMSTSSYVKYSGATAGQDIYSRYFLNVPSGTAPGVYSNIINFAIVQQGSLAGQGCV